MTWATGRNISVAVLSLCVFRSGLVAQPLGPTQRGVLTGPIADPGLTSSLRSSLNQLVLRGITEDAVASAEIGIHGPTWGIGLTASGPLEAAQTEVVFADLDGLRTAMTLGVSVNWLRWRTSMDTTALEQLCEEAGILPGDVCSDGRLPPHLRQRFQDKVDYGMPLFVRLSATFGRQSFSFIDDALAEQEANREPAGVAVSVGRYSSGTGFIGIAFKYQESFQAGTQTDLCTPVENTTALRCDQVRLGPPTARARSIASLEWRRYIAGDFAINPRLHRDVNAGVTAVELPVYFLRPSSAGLTGGVTIGWRSDSDEPIATFFVGQVLGIIAR